MKTLRVLIVDDHRDGADSLGLLVEELDHQTHVTYGGRQALKVASDFQPDLMFVDMAMPDLDGCSLVNQFRQMPAFAHTRIVAITGHTGEGHKNLAIKSGCDAVLFKPFSPTHIKAALESVAPLIAEADQACRVPERSRQGTVRILPVGEARRVRNERQAELLTESECAAAICEGFFRFQDEYLGWRSEQIQAYFIKGMLVVRLQGVLTVAEQRLGNSLSPDKGRDLIKQVRNQLLETGRPMLSALVHEVTGVKVRCLHYDISTVTGEEVVVFSLDHTPRFG